MSSQMPSQMPSPPSLHSVEIPAHSVKDFLKNLERRCSPEQPPTSSAPLWEHAGGLEDEGESSGCPSCWVPHLGRSAWLHDGLSFLVEYCEEGAPVASMQGAHYLRRLTLSGKDRAAVEAFAAAMLKIEKAPDPLELGRVRTWSSTHHGSWKSKGFAPAQSFDDLFLPKQAVADLLRRVDDFVASAERAARLGRMHKLNLLLMGVPGSGKSSLVRALARKYQRDLYLLTLGRRMDDEVCEELLMEMRGDAMLLVEDFDSLGFSRSAKKKSCKDEDIHAVTRSFFLNMLDGVLRPPTGTLVCLTCNSCTGLDTALARPGRVDVVVRFGPPQEPELLAALQRLTRPAGDEEARQVLFSAFCARLRKLAKDLVCMAGVVDHLHRHPVDFLDAFDEFQQRCLHGAELTEEGPRHMYM